MTGTILLLNDTDYITYGEFNHVNRCAKTSLVQLMFFESKNNLLINLNMNKLFRGLIAGYGAKKLGGGCLSTIIIFFIIYYLLGNCN